MNDTITDPRPTFSSCLDRAAGVIDAIGPDSLDDPTPCADYTVEQLAGHLVAAVRRVAAVARDEPARSVPPVIEGLAPDGFTSAFIAARAEQEAAWADPAILGRMLTLPFATLPGAAALATYISEITVHTWDLATALGVEVAWDQQVATTTLALMSEALPAEPRGAEIGVPFAPVVPAGPEATPVERLMAWMGRDPSWTAAAPA